MYVGENKLFSTINQLQQVLLKSIYENIAFNGEIMETEDLYQHSVFTNIHNYLYFNLIINITLFQCNVFNCQPQTQSNTVLSSFSPLPAGLEGLFYQSP